MKAETIEEVLEHLQSIIDQARADKHAIGLFAALYRKVTLEVKLKAEAGNYFLDDERMEKLDVVFANRYLDAVRLFRNKEPATASWQLSFDACADRKMLIVQHMLLGMNAHISLDLGIACAEVAEGDLSPAFEKDFLTINDILATMIDQIQSIIGRFSPFFHITDFLLNRTDEAITDFEIRIARDAAWRFARHLTAAPQDQWETLIKERDTKVAAFGKRLRSPGHRLIPLLLYLTHLTESKDIDRMIDALT